MLALFLDNPGLLEKVWQDPFEYAFGAIMVIFAAGLVVRFFKSEILGKDED